MLRTPDTVKFDASNKTHRAAVRSFLKRRAWGDSPIRFSHDPEYGSVADQVQAKMLQWYMAQDEAKDSKAAAKLVKVVNKTTIRQLKTA
jgi:hypothetical protein